MIFFIISGISGGSSLKLQFWLSECHILWLWAGAASSKLTFRRKRRKKGMFLLFWGCGQIATCVPKHPLSATKAGPYLWLSSTITLLFMNECKRLKEEHFAKQKTRVIISCFSEEGSYPNGQLIVWVPSALDPLGFG